MVDYRGTACKRRLQKIGNLSVAVAAPPQEFLEVQRTHGLRLLIADAVTLYSLDLYTKKRTAAYYVKAPILRKELERRGDFGKLLKFVEEQQSIPRLKVQTRVNYGNIPD